MAGIAMALPALLRAYKIGKRAASVGFDWPSAEPVRDKLDEELDELDTAMHEGSRQQIEAEMGDVLFSVVNLCRHLKLDPERALRRANDRFVQRFEHVESAVGAAGGNWQGYDAAGLEDLWIRAKRAETEGHS
jgi:ATP diphosphatase